jgi:hypothetical protein
MKEERKAREGPSYSDHGGLDSGEVPHMARWRNQPMWPYLRSNDPWKEWKWQRKALRCCCWKELGHGAMTTVHEREEAHGGNGASVLCSVSEMARERAGARVRVSGGSVAPLKTLRPDGWGHGQRTVAIARPRIGAGL